MGKRANPMAVKSALTYEVAEAARALDKSPATIRNWIKDGLPIMAAKKPYLISGAALRDYLRAKYQSSKTTLAADELYCLSCRKGRHPVAMAVEAIPNNRATTRLVGVCQRCGATASRLISNAKAQEFARIFSFKNDGKGNAYKIPRDLAYPSLEQDPAKPCTLNRRAADL